MLPLAMLPMQRRRRFHCPALLPSAPLPLPLPALLPAAQLPLQHQHQPPMPLLALPTQQQVHLRCRWALQQLKARTTLSVAQQQ